MPLWHRQTWTPADIPDLAFGASPVEVDIGFLAGDEHRAAFALIFERMVRDNATRLSDMQLVGIEAPRPVSLSRTSLVPPPVSLSQVDLATLALALYDSHNERVVLHLTGPGGSATLGVRFDNPGFWFAQAAV